MEKISNKDKQFPPLFWGLLAGFFVLVVLILFLPSALTQRQWFGLNFKDTGQIGDTIGGIVGPFIAIIASVLTFIAFWVQFKANQQQKRDLQIERFESRLFSMLETHRNNVSEITISNPIWIESIDNKGNTTRSSSVEITTGRPALAIMYAELREMFQIVRDYHQSADYQNGGGLKVSDQLIFETAYLLFFFGVGIETEEISKSFWPELQNPYFLCALEHLQTLQKRSRNASYGYAKDYDRLFLLNKRIRVIEEKPKYLIGQGHAVWFSHYFRQIFHMVDFIDSNKSEWMGDVERAQYARLIRSQLSTYEQCLLYYNALSVMGRPWIKNGLLKKYPLLRSLPLPLVDFHWNPTEILGGEVGDKSFVFDWLEIKERYRTNDFSTPPQG